MNAVGIDVSKGKSMMAALRPMGEVALRTKEYPHTEAGLEQMALAILALGEDTWAVMEATGRYHEPVAAALTNNLIPLTDKVFPGVNELFSSPEQADGSVKWVDFVMTFWHCECINLASEAAFTERCRKWCKRKGYHFSPQKTAELYMDSAGHITTLPRNSNTRLLITTAAKELASAKSTLAVLRVEMDRLARQLPEYDTVRAIYGVGEKTAPPLIAKIGDVRRFPQRSSISAFAGVDPTVDDSGKRLVRGGLAQIGADDLVQGLAQMGRAALGGWITLGEPVYQFLNKKRSKGKPYFVYMTAAENKFLHIYYARVKECFNAADNQETA